MDTMVSARVPVEICEQGRAALAKLGATTTQLINAAFEYVLATGSLPVAQDDAPAGDRVLGSEQLAELYRSIEASTVDVPEDYFEGKTYKELIEEERYGKYMSLDAA